MWAIIGRPAKRHFNGVSLVGRLLPAYGDFWCLALLEKKQNNKLIRVGPPLTKFSGFAHDVSYLYLEEFIQKFGIKIFEIDIVIENYLYLTF